MRYPGALACVALTAIAGLASGQTAARHGALVEERMAYVSGGAPLRGGRWNGSRLLSRDLNGTKSPIIIAVDDTGLREEITLELPGAAMIAIHDLAAGPDGAIVVAGHGVNDTPRFAPFLAVISPDR